MTNESASSRLLCSGLQRQSLKLLPLKLAGAYFVVAVLWTFVSHFWLDTFVPSSVELEHLQSIEDLLFAGITAGMLYWLVHRSLHTLQQTETTLRASEERLRLILQKMPVMLNAFDRQGNIIIWNHECERVTGYSAAEIIGNPQAMALLYPDAIYRQQMTAYWIERGNDYRNWEWNLVSKDGTEKTVAWSNISDRFPIPGWKSWGIGVDETDRKRTEANLRVRNRELLTLHRISEITLNQQSLNAAFQDIVKEISAATAFPIIAIELYDATRQVMVFEGTEGIPLPPDGKPIEVPVTQTSSGTVVQTGQMLVKTYDPQEPKKCDSNESLRKLGIKTFICVPMTVNQTTIGVLSLAHPEVVPTENDFLQWLTSLANYLALLTDRKRSETALRESEARFRLVTETIQEVFWLCSADKSQVFYVSPAYEQIWGRSCDNIYQNPRSILDTIHLDDLEHVKVNLAYPNEASHQFEYRIIKPDGAIRWIVNRSFPIRDAAGTVSRTAGVSRDITDHKQSEIALRDSEVLFRSLSASSPIGIYLTRTDGYTTYTNPRCQEIFGFTLAESLGDGWLEWVHPDDRERLFQAWYTAVASGEPYFTDYRVQRREGNLRWVQTRAAPMRSDHGELIGYVGTLEDVTDRKQAEAQILQLNQTLEQQNLKLEALVEQRTAELMTFMNTLPDYIFVVDRDTMQMSFCNDLTAQLIGWESHHQVAGKTIFECFPPELSATFAAENQQVFETGKMLHHQETYPTPLGTLNFDTYKIPLKKPNGDVYALIGTARNITELVEARQKIVDRTVQLEIVNRELESFSYSVSHDLRAPLRHIGGFVTALTDRLQKDGQMVDPTVAHYLQIIQDSSHKMGALIDGLLTLSRVGRRQMAATRVDLDHLVAAVLAQRSEVITSSTTEAVSDRQPVQFSVGALPSVNGDATLLQQVFVNLLDNAIKFSRHRQPAHIEIGALSDGIIFVRDRGVGFQMEYADQLFGAFQRLHSQSEFEGSGIGLAIVQRIIHRHGGKIWAESQPNQGATFYFTLGDRLKLLRSAD